MRHFVRVLAQAAIGAHEVVQFQRATVATVRQHQVVQVCRAEFVGCTEQLVQMVVNVAEAAVVRSTPAIVAGVCAIRNKRVDGVVIVTPTGVHTQFAHEVQRLVSKALRARFALHTHHKFFHPDTPLDTLRRKLLVVDAAHALATTIVRDRETGEVATGKMAYHATRAAEHAAQVLLLTATPVKNAPSELFNLLCMVQQQPYERFYREHAVYRTDLDKLFREYLRTGNEYLLQRKRRKNVMVQAYVEKVRPISTSGIVGEESLVPRSPNDT